MNPRLRGIFSATIGQVPVTVRAGLIRGARWTLYPWTSYWRGTYEPAVQRMVVGLGGGDIRGWSCWDLGAHFGFYSIALAMRAGPEGQVAAFEPNPLSFARLERHRRMNDVACLRTYRAAASDRSGEAKLLTYGTLDSTSTHLRYDDEAKNAQSAPIRIRTVRLDELVESGELRAPRFVKIDVEGHAHRALGGMTSTLAASRPVLLVAFYTETEAEDSLRILGPLGYRRTTVVPSPSGPDSIVGGDFCFTFPRPLG